MISPRNLEALATLEKEILQRQDELRVDLDLLEEHPALDGAVRQAHKISHMRSLIQRTKSLLLSLKLEVRGFQGEPIHDAWEGKLVLFSTVLDQISRDLEAAARRAGSYCPVACANAISKPAPVASTTWKSLAESTGVKSAPSRPPVAKPSQASPMVDITHVLQHPQVHCHAEPHQDAERPHQNAEHPPKGFVGNLVWACPQMGKVAELMKTYLICGVLDTQEKKGTTVPPMISAPSSTSTI
eukprot:CAMPEP_0114544514 /NCGR_PEP_ID=MMETSP0114-20121206/2918_1 /TAXON_ID=31324 /ORGANISM="Goniomonas sp, Strain m" /LENGTH=241 /DNA_ID=CAMNT_0001728901 /DNA_START=53 /DNA_END=778 /DNA_ORIENTATION=-